MVREVVFTPDGRHFATASFDGTARVWETATGRPAGPQLPHNNYVATVAFSPDGKTLVAGDYGPAGLIKLWDWRTGKEVRPPLRHDDIVLNVAFSPTAATWPRSSRMTGPRIPSSGLGSRVRTAVIQVRHTGPSYTLRETARFRPDGRAITTRDANGVLPLGGASASTSASGPSTATG
jgi:WD40 repeat protein